ncbi:MAG: hypothetical protein C0611_04775 [Desulfobacteraceae bacterium]|nr:MAG: hypothetical protein C0611_04775 [Desulfobacteraceae bacterium]
MEVGGRTWEDGRKADAFCRPSSQRSGLPSSIGFPSNLKLPIRRIPDSFGKAHGGQELGFRDQDG